MARHEAKYGSNRRKGARSQEAGRPEATGEVEEEPTPSPSRSRGLVSIAISVALAAAIVTTCLQMSGTGSRTATTTTTTTSPPPPPPPAAPATTRLAVCAAVRDSPENIIEWIDYHRAPAIGVDKFYLMVTDDPDVAVLEEALGPLIAGSVVELYDLQHVNPTTVSQLQVNLYARCLDAVRDKHDFVGFWDVDEFIVPRADETQAFREFLGDPDVMNAGGVALNWRIVGPSGHDVRPASGGILENYRSCTHPTDYAENEEIKSVVRTAHAVRPMSDPHTFEYQEGYHAIDPEKRPVTGGRHPEGAKAPRWRLYHFVTKSREEYRAKMRRGSAMGNRKDMGYFEMLMDVATMPC